ncbi:uncharacterized protein I303_100378 [Kwoniella dejecticola CBS 10117]|uniref:Bromodomain-containing factor 1 n=1 Tax=Kwoniella dejecticola CBS 10117 TaxID=1296121 RepID=A0A1A6AES5_9TREE|nr:uncharacterized protein I303_00378 [Kwoniella dejecticola CBS 10117]OBR88561.1 hypothetical protein I303_00378 [Kwoniella dejecticola CBS 10117]
MSQPEEPSSVPPPPPPAESIPQPPAAEAIADKPLLNPLQSDAHPAASTVVEPPKSPNPANPATNEQGNAAADGADGTASNGLPSNGLPSLAPQAPVETPALPSPPSEPAVAAPNTSEQLSKSPLPPDATVPPTPRAEDEAPPTLPPDAIPPAVPTPSVITTEEQEAKGGILGVSEQASLPTPGPEESAQTPVVSAAEPTAEPIDVDMDKPVEGTPAAPALQSSQSDGSLKRSGDSLEDGRDEKRLKEDSIPNGTPVPQTNVAPTSTPAPQEASAPIAPPQPTEAPSAVPISSDNAPPPTPAWLTYQPPAPRPSGPTTPLTLHQHKHLLNAVRALKKKPEAGPFHAPVDPIALNIPHYPDIINTPMDLGTVETKLVVSDPRGPPKDQSKAKKWDTSKGSYGSYSEVVVDVRQIWENTRKFNGPVHFVTGYADKLDIAFESALSKIPPEPVIAPPPPPTAARVATPPAATPVAGPSSTRRASISQPPTIRRSSDDSRPKREIHPPPSKDLAYEETAGSVRKPKRRNDVQLQWGLKVVKSLETVQKFYPAVSPFLYSVAEIIQLIPEYTSVIKKPIDLLQIKEKLEEGVYDDVHQLDSDMKLMVANAQKFNPPGDPVSIAATQLLQIWNEKWQSLPPKQEVRDSSEDPLADNYEDDGYHSEEDSKQLKSLEAQVSSLNDQIFELRAKIAKGRADRPAKSAKPKHAKSGSNAQQQRKQSNAAKQSPGVNGNGHGAQSSAKKSKKTKEVYRDEDEDMESEDEPSNTITLTQKQELAEKIQEADGNTLQEAITIIQKTTNLGSNNEEIELDIDSLPIATQIQLYNLVCKRKAGGGKSRKSAGTGPTKKQSKKAGTKRGVNEREEAERIKRMEAQLQSFDSRQSGGVPQASYEEGESSSEEESSDEE